MVAILKEELSLRLKVNVSVKFSSEHSLNSNGVLFKSVRTGNTG